MVPVVVLIFDRLSDGLNCSACNAEVCKSLPVLLMFLVQASRSPNVTSREMIDRARNRRVNAMRNGTLQDFRILHEPASTFKPRNRFRRGACFFGRVGHWIPNSQAEVNRIRIDLSYRSGI